MQDQASRLRDMLRGREGVDNIILSRVLAVTSGKGGVGKSNMATNLAIALAKYGKKVLLIDFDLGLANIDILFGIYPKFTLRDVIFGNKELMEIVIKGPEGLMIIPASSGIEEMLKLNTLQKEKLIKDMSLLKKEIDIVIVDTGSGIYSDVIRMLLAANAIMIITTPEPTAITDAYAVIKVISRYKKSSDIKLVVNMCRNINDAQNTGKKIMAAAKRFLDINIKDVWVVPYDDQVQRSVRLQKPFIIQYPDAIASANMRRIAGNLLSGIFMSPSQQQEEAVGVEGYFQRLVNL